MKIEGAGAYRRRNGTVVEIDGVNDMGQAYRRSGPALEWFYANTGETAVHNPAWDLVERVEPADRPI